MSLDRLPPQSVEAEQSVLGALLIDRDAVVEVAEILRADDFYRAQHAEIYGAVLDLYERREPVDIVTVSEVLERRDQLEHAGGSAYLTSLINLTPTAVNAVHYARIVERKAVLRNLIGAAGRIAGIGYEETADVDASIDRAEQELFAVSQKRVASGFSQLRTLLHSAYDRLDYLHQHKGEISGITTGFRSLDAMTTGLQKSDLIILAARPSIGKTSLALNFAEYAAVVQRKTVGVFSLEMSKEQLVLRLLSSVANIDSQRLRTGFLEEMDFTRLAPAMNALAEAPIYIDDTPNVSTMELRTKARRLQAESGLDLLIVDYLQLMRSSVQSRDANRVQEVSEISRGLKGLARELQVPVVALSQLSRQVEMRTNENKEPRLSDLRESGCLTADTRVQRSDTGAEESLGDLLERGERNIPVWSVDERLRVVPRTMTHVFPSGVKPVFRMRLASGREIKATANHPFLTLDGWTPLGELSVGSRLAVPRRIPQPSSAVEWPEAEVILLAHLIGDGCVLRNHPVQYTNADPANLDAVEQAATHFGVTARRVAQENWFHSYLPAPYPVTHGRHNPIVAWLMELGLFDRRAPEKFVPPGVFGLSDDQVALFLRHIWATDGSVTLGKAVPVRIYFASTSERLVADIQALLLRLDVYSTIRAVRSDSRRTGFTLDIYGVENQMRFLVQIGVHGARGALARQAQERLMSVRANTNVDTVPIEVWRRVRAARAAIGMTERALQAAVGSQYNGSAFYRHSPSRTRLQRVADVLQDSELSDLATNDLFWDRVVEMEALGEQPVYDATVPGTHNFVANGIATHNSIEQDSDLVMFLWREKERSEEDSVADEDGEVVNLSLAKHRNGPTGHMKLWFKKQQTRFVSLEEDRIPSYA